MKMKTSVKGGRIIRNESQTAASGVLVQTKLKEGKMSVKTKLKAGRLIANENPTVATTPAAR